MHSLYLCYFGLREPLVQTQVLPYLRQLAAAGVRLGLLTFEPEAPGGWSGTGEEAWRKQLAGEGIRWIWRRYHKRPPAASTLYDIRAGISAARAYVKEHGPCLLHARGHWAGAMAAPVARAHGVPFLFDIRGLAPEEYVDAGLWRPGGLRYRAAKRLERDLLDAATGFVVLTHRARELLFPGCKDADRNGRPIRVIPCCVDLKRFEACWREDRQALRHELGLPEGPVYVYLGALGGWYLTREMAALFHAALERTPTARALVITQSNPAQITGPFAALGGDVSRITCLRAAPAEVPRLLRAADVAVSLIKPSYSKQASSPTKLAEYLAAGLPVIANTGVGDVDTLVRQGRVGILLRDFSRQGFNQALADMDQLRQDPELVERCRQVAEQGFDLVSVGGARYRDLYCAIAERERAG